MASIFSKIINGEIKGEIIHQDEHCAVLKDIHPQAPMHLLVVPKKEIQSVGTARLEDQSLLGHLLLTAAQVMRAQGYDKTGYRVVINFGEDGGMTVPHLHLHILAGRELTWPPG